MGIFGWFRCDLYPLFVRMDALSGQLTRTERKIMATIEELVALSTVAVTGIADVKAAVDTLEAAVTAALAQIPNIPPEVQAGIDAAFANMTAAVAGAQEAVRDAGDGVDEAV